ncbi:MAG: 30S ribosomal protein S6 [Candidatus Sumerlaeota bacterium]|nr:30S ribosomal protein S6 [Candidatus Sumerlaeota bacterium]
MAVYEIVVILDPALNDDQAVAQVEDIKRRLSETKGIAITAQNHWGRRKMAYPVEKKPEGNYIVFRFTHDPTGGAVDFTELERHLRFSEAVMRHIFVRIPDEQKDSPILTPQEYTKSAPGSRRYTRSQPAPAAEAAKAPVEGAPAAAAEGVAVVAEAVPAAEPAAAEPAALEALLQTDAAVAASEPAPVEPVAADTAKSE